MEEKEMQNKPKKTLRRSFFLSHYLRWYIWVLLCLYHASLLCVYVFSYDVRLGFSLNLFEILGYGI